MAVSINGETKTLGIALSGAPALHLGVFTELGALNLLDKLDLLACVSGGSIAGGFLASNWNAPDGLERLANYLSTKSIAISSVVGRLISPFSTSLEKLAESYERDLVGPKTLSDLRDGPRVYFNATNLSTGNTFFFVAGKCLAPGGDSGITIGEHDSGTIAASNFPAHRDRRQLKLPRSHESLDAGGHSDQNDH
ncbi:hypothetical protein ACC755_09810 [Rhizobium ruizarguesonis]|uniref:hypothetical protein n=1 Tax=Rhizobium ruizarguesonis TaxID=2081791 RepID=UPI001FE0CF9E|nr:hypothetical protein [Rhizobium ruizarguesonis]